MSERCPVCLRAVNGVARDQDPVIWDCPGCGYFSLTAALIPDVEAALQADPGLRPRLSRVLRLASDRAALGVVEPLLPVTPGTSSLSSLLLDRASVVAFPSTVSARLDVAIARLVGLSARVGGRVSIESKDLAAFCSRMGVLDSDPDGYLWELARLGWIDVVQDERGRVDVIVVTGAGWARVEALQNGLPDSTLVFLALSNHYGEGAPPDTAARLSQAIAAALPAPLSAYRVENDHSAVHITDEIVANIRRARFVVADLTCARPNVYFEAGLAMGLGKPVVFTRRSGEDAHFDVAAYKILEWAPDALPAFTRALKDHLAARALIQAV